MTTISEFGLHIYRLVFSPKPNSNFGWLGFPHHPQGKPNPIRSFPIWSLWHCTPLPLTCLLDHTFYLWQASFYIVSWSLDQALRLVLLFPSFALIFSMTLSWLLVILQTLSYKPLQWLCNTSRDLWDLPLMSTNPVATLSMFIPFTTACKSATLTPCCIHVD